MTDYTTPSGARLLASKLRAYWAARGYALEPVTAELAPRLHVVRSDLVNGLPRGCDGNLSYSVSLRPRVKQNPDVYAR